MDDVLTHFDSTYVNSKNKGTLYSLKQSVFDINYQHFHFFIESTQLDQKQW